MIFAHFSTKHGAMKKFLYFITGILLMSSCASSNVQESSGKTTRSERKLVRQEEIKKAVSDRRFIIKLDKIYFTRGGMVDLVPKANYIIVDGDKVIISAAYIGRQFSGRPIAGINMIGKAVTFELKNNTSKGTYAIRMEVKNEANSFDVYVTINSAGNCNASFNNYKLDAVRYTGNFVPLREKEQEKVDNYVMN